MNSSDKAHKKIKICFADICGVGGMFHYAAALCEAYRRFGDASLISVPKWIDRFRSEPGFVGKLRKKYNPIYYKALAKEIIKTEKPDLVHVTSDAVGLMFFVRHLKRNKVKVVYTVHDPTPHEEFSTPWGKVFSWVNRKFLLSRTLQEADLVHVHSELHKAELVAYYGQRIAEKTCVVPHGGGAIEAILAGTLQPPELPLDKVGFVFLFFGRIEPYKGIGVLLEAFRQLRLHNGNSQLIIAGSGNLTDHTEQAKAPGVYVLNRYIADEEIRQIFEYSDVVVLPYLTATQSGVVHLAYEFRKPVIASRVGALPEIVIEGKTGKLVEPGDATVLFEAMAEYIDCPDQAKDQGDYARDFMETTFAWLKVASMHHDWHSRVLECEPPTPGATN